MKKIVVTGAAGYIGSTLVKKLVEAGHKVSAFYILMSSSLKKMLMIGLVI